MRVDAKASGVGVSGAKVEDNKDGTYTISLTAGPPGEIKVVVRIDGNDLPPYLLTVQRAPESADASGMMAKEADTPPLTAAEAAAPAATVATEQAEGNLKSKGKGGAATKGDRADKGGGGEPLAAGGSKEETPKGGGKAERMPKDVPPVPWQSPSVYYAMAEAPKARAAELLAQVGQAHGSFESQLGAAILSR